VIILTKTKGSEVRDTLPLEPLLSSSRDPNGFVFEYQNTVLRKVTEAGLIHYRRLVDSGLYRQLLSTRLLIPHDEVANPAGSPPGGTTLRPQQIRMITYPYEWCFSQLRDSALATLDIQETALRHDMELRDATPFNVQLIDGRPALIDISSLGIRKAGAPWTAYRQFCELFLFPLAAAAYVGPEMLKLIKSFPDGLPVHLAPRLLPLRARLSFNRLLHLYFYPRLARASDALERERFARTRQISVKSQLGLVESLRQAVTSLPRITDWSAWSGYYALEPSYAAASLEAKRRIVQEIVDKIAGRTIWDLGSNLGLMTSFANNGALVVAIDSDHASVERLYKAMRKEGRENLIPLWIDATNPTPAMGLNLRERMSLEQRGHADVVLMLALIHHLAIGRNVPLDRIATLLASAGRHAVVEFVPDDDPMVRILREGRDSLQPYSVAAFREAMSRRFELVSSQPIPGSGRIIFHYVQRGSSA
jgi:hypothetical protein